MCIGSRYVDGEVQNLIGQDYGMESTYRGDKARYDKDKALALGDQFIITNTPGSANNNNNNNNNHTACGKNNITHLQHNNTTAILTKLRHAITPPDAAHHTDAIQPAEQQKKPNMLHYSKVSMQCNSPHNNFECCVIIITTLAASWRWLWIMQWLHVCLPHTSHQAQNTFY